MLTKVTAVTLVSANYFFVYSDDGDRSSPRRLSVRFIRGHLIYYETKYFSQDSNSVSLDFQIAWNERSGLLWFRTGIWKLRVFRSGVNLLETELFFLF